MQTDETCKLMKKTASENSGKEQSRPTSADSTASAKPRKQKKRVSSSEQTSHQDGGAQLSEKKSSTSTKLELSSNSTPKKLKTLRRLAEKELFETENFLEGVLAAISIGATVRSAAASHEIRYSALQARLNQADMKERYRAAQQASADALAEKSQELFMEGKRGEATQIVPDEFCDEISLVGPAERIRDRLQAWKETPVTELLVMSRDKAQLRQIAELVLG